MNLYVLPAGPIQTNAYLLTAPDRGEALLIDAPGGIWAQIEQLLTKDRCALAELWVTHGHWDHTQGAAEVVRETDATVRAHPDDQVLIETPEVMRAFMDRRMTVEPVKVDAWVGQGDEIDVLGCTFEVRHVPGHCPGNIMFYSAAMQGAFVGDALFRGSIGRTDLPGGKFDQLEAAIRRQIYSLPDETKIYPGHGPATTVGAERRTNPYVHD
ncbi:MAG: MBL fold metallo-hydrolase [Opitutaceae bacterium]|nr:MBL fold metallo-hydrolase [Opitutaceae bacterium]